MDDSAIEAQGALMILEPADETCNEIDALQLFLGPEPLRVLGQTSGEGWSPSAGHPHETFGSLLVLAGSDSETTAERLPVLLAHGRSCLSDAGRIAVLARNRAYGGSLGSRARALAMREYASEPPMWPAFSPTAVLETVRRAGFEGVSLFAVAPSPGDPSELRPFSLKDHLFAPAFLVTAGRIATGGYLLDRAIEALGSARSAIESSVPQRLVQVINSPRGKSIAIVARNRLRSVIRIARSATMREDEAVSYRILEQLKASTAVAGLVPHPRGAHIEGRFAFFEQSHLPGVPLSASIRGPTRVHYVREVERFLRGLNEDLPGRRPVSFDSDLATSNIQPMVEFALRHVADNGLRTAVLNGLADSLKGASGRLGVVHGDFGTSNILVEGQRISGVIDWEAARPWGPPVLDAFNYLDSAHRSCVGNVSIVDTLPLLAGGAWPVAEEEAFLRSMFEFCGIDFRFRRGLALLYALFHFGPQLRFARADGSRKRLEQVLRWFVAT